MPQHPYKTSIKVGGLTVLCLFLLASYPLQALADLEDIPDVGLPGRRVGGGTRDGCYGSPKVLQALTPPSHLGRTIKSNPTFFVYLPPHNAESAEFVLEDTSDRVVYKTRVPISGSTGIVSISLPTESNRSLLEVNQLYRWSFQLLCPSARDEIAYGDHIDGWIKREAATLVLERQLTAMSPRDRATRYAGLGLWYDTLETLAQEIRTSANPQLRDDWKSLLTSVGLTEVAEEPLASCCSMQ
ncbi:DUF928 domain-containing protein [Desertifilum sp. FACHB-1129]|uniref:DUF928 domain-containing protein n=1 Tax=Desertifilum tharense IPPAS B-1220 TaxID=1781255 RepID=A0A1E5QIQ3_9CYAN|nr:MULTISPECIES: DUF928 domain-containing protein [Desertifilum]MDA0211919.1 DUF928 domain-containing protein [Cyanobacteria bacterium FC1]MBD2314014.1 DUF928 domain-containing protein [Desertifilum sp. FACHB-1129]MBD2320340.1 DUF928 domain-containing protein [Desertifilum sp. FACHB-866]MBD2330468.1 DUF928 domain-containing protein [Desertifilum sp. FACHB-868]OEJ74223.1 hypothetical protein BH720_15575 [Desertifilum tharense IPPAS B-1220]